TAPRAPHPARRTSGCRRSDLGASLGMRSLPAGSTLGMVVSGNYFVGATTGRDVYASFVAVGDSFTEGLDDLQPDGTYRGWADLVAAPLGVTGPPTALGD